MRNRLLWLIPIVVGIAVLTLSTHQIATCIGAAIALALLAYFVGRPGAALIALIIFLPLEQFAFALLLQWHVPASLLKPASGIKELLALAILIAAVKELRAGTWRPDRLDTALLIYVGVVTIYLLVPHLFSAIAPTVWHVRLLAWRSDAGYPLLFLAARHAPIDEKHRQRFIQVILVMGGLVACIAIFQRLAATTWSDFILNSVNLPAYQAHVLGLAPADIVSNLRYLYTVNPLRASSLFFSPFDMGDYLVLVCAIAGVRITRGHRALLPYLVLGTSLAALFFSRSRSDGLAVVVILVLIVLPSARSPIEGRLRLIGALLLAAVVLVPALGGTRFVGAQGGAASATGHLAEIKDGFNILDHAPLGIGLGAQPGAAQRSVQTITVFYGGNVSDNVFLQVGDELGIQALLPWLAMLGLVLWGLKRRGSGGDAFAAAMGFGLLGVVIAGLYHHVFLTYPVPWTLWAGAGLALSTHVSSTADTRSTHLFPVSAGVP
jgi:hypothetical protein